MRESRAARNVPGIQIRLDALLWREVAQPDWFSSIQAFVNALEIVQFLKAGGVDFPDLAGYASFIRIIGNHSREIAQVNETVPENGARGLDERLTGQKSVVAASAFQRAVNKNERVPRFTHGETESTTSTTIAVVLSRPEF